MLTGNVFVFSESGKVIHKKNSEEEDMDELKEQKVRGVGKMFFCDARCWIPYSQKPEREPSGSVVKCLTQDWGVAGLSLTGIVTALCPWASHFNPCLVLVQPRNIGPHITDKLLTGT